MKTFFVVFLTSLMAINGLKCQSITEKTYGTQYADEIVCSIPMADSSAIHFMNKSLDTLCAITIFKTNKKGMPLWAKTTGFNYNKVKSAIRTFDGNVVFAGLIPAQQRYFLQFKKALIAKMDTSGNVLWTHIYKLGVSAEATKILQLPDSSLFITGYAVDQNEIPNNRVIGIHLDKNGNEIKTFTYFNGYGSVGNDAIFCHDSTIMIVGSVANNGTALQITSIDLNGQSRWNKILEGEKFTSYKFEGYAVTTDASDNYYITGSANNDILCVKLNPNYEVQWSRSYNLVDSYIPVTGLGIQCYNDSVIVLSGQTIGIGDYVETPGDIITIGIDAQGDTLWTSTIGSAGNDHMTSLSRISDSILCINGSTFSFTTEGDYDGYQINYMPGKNVCHEKNIQCSIDTLIFNETDSIVGWGAGLVGQDSVFIWINDTIGFHDACICVPPVAYFEWEGIDGNIYIKNLSTGTDSWYWITEVALPVTNYNPIFYGEGLNICLRVENECGSDQYCEVAFGNITAAGEFQFSPNAYPVPSSDKVYLQFENTMGDPDIRIFDAAGNQVKNYPRYAENTLTISKQETGSGLFIVTFMLDSKIIAWRKIIFE